MTEFEILNQLIKDAAKILTINENGKVIRAFQKEKRGCCADLPYMILQKML